jgi:hypothetical protein
VLLGKRGHSGGQGRAPAGSHDGTDAGEIVRGAIAKPA